MFRNAHFKRQVESSSRAALSRRTPLIIIAALGISACARDNAATGPRSPATISLEIVAGNSQIGPTGQELSTPIQVKVVDKALAIPVPGYLINWVVTAGGGTVFAASTETDYKGLSRNYWTLGTAGPQTLEVRAISPITGAKEVFATFTATAVAPTPPVTSEINTTGGWDGNRQIGMFGALPASTVFGQSFTVPAGTPLLNSFSFWLNAGGGWQPNVTFAAYVMGWDGSKAVGPVLWKSAAFSGPTTTMQRYDFKVPSLALTPGGQYIAFLSTIEYLTLVPTNAQVLMGYVYNPYSGGRFYDFSTSDFSALTTTSWGTDAGGDFDAAFVADFSSVPLTP